MTDTEHRETQTRNAQTHTGHRFDTLKPGVVPVSERFNTGRSSTTVYDPVLAEVATAGVPGGLNHAPRIIATVTLIEDSLSDTHPTTASNLRNMGDAYEDLAEEFESWLFDHTDLEGDLRIRFRFEGRTEQGRQFKASIPRPSE